jgi:serine/threonine-protein kinase
VPLSLDEVCMRALERDPARRYPTAAAFASALDEAYGRKMMPVREVGELVTTRLAGSIERQKLALRRASAEPAPASPLATATTTGAMAPPAAVPAGVPAKRPALGAIAAVAAGMLGVIALSALIAFFMRAPAPPSPPPSLPSPVVTTIAATAEPIVPTAATSAPPPRATIAAPVSTARRTHPRGGNKKPLPGASATGTFTPSEP